MEIVYGTNSADGWQLNSDSQYFALSGNDTIYGSNGSDSILGNGGKDNLLGNSGSDTLIGGVGGDSLSGGEGNDWLLGSSSYNITQSPEIDTLTGGAGADTFLLSATTVGGQTYLYDRFGSQDIALITDYNVASDKIILPGLPQDYVLGDFGAELIIGIDSDKNGKFSFESDEAIAVIIDSSFNLNQASYIGQTA